VGLRIASERNPIRANLLTAHRQSAVLGSRMTGVRARERQAEHNPLKINAALAADLTLLNGVLNDPDVDLADLLRLMASDTRLAVPSYLGLSLTVLSDGQLMGFTALEDEAESTEVLSSLLLRLPGAPRAAGEPSVALVLYAARPGAFVDLAADVAWLTDRPLSSVVLDRHLAVPDGQGDLDAVRTASVVNQAIGVLIAFGYTPAAAERELNARASAGIDQVAVARLILDLPHGVAPKPEPDPCSGRHLPLSSGAE
jgi:hypothetical protein